jgi:hypothetical protein
VERAIGMQQIMVNVPDEIAERLASRPDELPQILVLGLPTILNSKSDGSESRS